MLSASQSSPLKIHAPSFLGAVFCALICVCSISCREKSGTPDWDAPETSAAESATSAATPVNPEPALLEVSTPKKEPADKSESDATRSPGLKFIAYNVENWLTMDRYVEGKTLKGAPKPVSEKAAVVTLLARHSPDVLGLCEIGEASDLAEIQAGLKAAGLDLPNLHYTGGSDLTRHLGILSKYPITSTAKPAETEYQLNGKTFAINRGILDATIDARGKIFRFVGVHLKSKRDSEQGDQEAIRLNEAQLLRQHLDSILKTDPASRIVLYGDFNDTRATPVIKKITGKYNSPTYFTAIPAKDSHGEAWTHYWALNDIYSRIDFVMVSPALKKDVNFKASKILDDPEWNDASDHRAVLTIFK